MSLGWRHSSKWMRFSVYPFLTMLIWAGYLFIFHKSMNKDNLFHFYIWLLISVFLIIIFLVWLRGLTRENKKYKQPKNDV